MFSVAEDAPQYYERLRMGTLTPVGGSDMLQPIASDCINRTGGIMDFRHQPFFNSLWLRGIKVLTSVLKQEMANRQTFKPR